MATSRYAPEFSFTINDEPIPAALRSSVSSVNYQTGLEGADRVELTLANENLRWLDHPLFNLDNKLTLSIGYAPEPLDRVFVGEIVGQNASFPGGGIPTLTIVAQDRLHRLQKGNKARWFAIRTPIGNFPLPDQVVTGIVSIENALIPITDPIGAALAVLVGAIEIFANGQEVIRKQPGESDFTLLARISEQNGWEMFIDHEARLGGYVLRFMSPLAHLEPDLTLKYGQSMIDFTPRISDVGQFVGVTVRLWQPDLKIEFTVTASWDFERNSLDVTIFPSFGGVGASAEDLGKPTVTLIEEPVTLASAGRVILSKLIPTLNKRLTGSGSTIGDTRIKAGSVLRVEGLGEHFGGLYRVTSATHTIDSGGYRTSFELRKEVWFGSIPLVAQGAVPVRLQGQLIGAFA
jgi:hypothetical protein